jgi:ABC-type branched-subunit amino acid transport system ATPase component
MTASAAPTLALKVDDLRVSYGAVQAVAGIQLAVEPGQCVGLVGANGAGKTSTLHAIGGLIPCARTSLVELAGASLDRVSAPERARRRLGHVLEGRHVFTDLTVGENLELGAAGGPRAGRKEALASALEVLPELVDMLGRPAGTLSGGQQQILAIGRALAGHPQILMLDEPTNGLAPILVNRVVSIIKDVRARGIGVLLVEQRLEVAQAACDVVHVLQHGKVIEVRRGDDPELPAIVHAAYLS